VVLQFSGSTTPIGAIDAEVPHLLVVFNCKLNFNFETLNTTNRCGATTTIAPLHLVLLYLYHQQVWCYSVNSTNWSDAIVLIAPIGVVLPICSTNRYRISGPIDFYIGSTTPISAIGTIAPHLLVV
jgi:hypothetical protein